ncbi:MAG: LytTR family DNA-binding domain-containing protein, partial [Bacteroidota bacterium]
MKLLILEDEEVAARNLHRMLRRVAPEVHILDTLKSVEAARQWFRQHAPPDLILLDIHLSDGLSFAAFQSGQENIPVIFTTAYDQYALKAFELNSVDYLVKPFSEHQLRRALDKWSQRRRAVAPTNWTAIQQMLQNPQSFYKTRFHVKKGDQILIVQSEQIAFLYRDEYVFLYTLEGKRFLVELSLDYWMDQLNPHTFYRANRQFIVNIQAIERIETHFNYKLKLHVTPQPPQAIFVAKDRARA